MAVLAIAWPGEARDYTGKDFLGSEKQGCAGPRRARLGAAPRGKARTKRLPRLGIPRQCCAPQGSDGCGKARSGDKISKVGSGIARLGAAPRAKAGLGKERGKTSWAWLGLASSGKAKLGIVRLG